MISITNILIEYDTAQNFANRNLNQQVVQKPTPAELAEEKMRAQRLSNIKNSEVQKPTFNPAQEIKDSEARQTTAEAQGQQIKDKVQAVRDNLANEESIKQQIAKNQANVMKKGIKKAIPRTNETPDLHVSSGTAQAPVKTSAMEDLGSAARKVGSGIKKGTEAGIEAAKGGIKKVGQEVAEHPGAAAGLAAGAGLAAYVGKKVFGKPRTATA